MKRLPKGFYLGSIIGGEVGGGILLLIGLVVFVIALITAGAFSDDFYDFGGINISTLAIGIVLIVLGYAAILFGAVIWFILIYRAWEAIQNGNARTTPGKAVGFLFIPFFNLYWIFMVWYGFAQDYNRYIEHEAISARKLEESLFLVFCILYVCSCIPYIGSLATLGALAILIISANAVIDAVNALPTRTTA